MGPNALDQLRCALAERRLSFATETWIGLRCHT